MAEFDEQLKQRLIAFQRHHGLSGDGVAGAETWTRLVRDADGGHGEHASAGEHGRAGPAADTAPVAGPARRGGDSPGTGACGCADEAGAAANVENGEPPELDGVLEEGDAEDGEEEVAEGVDVDDAVGLQAQRRPGRRRPPSSVPAGCRATAKACFSISQQKAWLLRRGRVVVVAVPALGGRSGHPTPTGHFNVQFLDKDHVSSIYNAPMPFYVNFTTAIGFHAGSLRVRSHGCVHLSRANAERFFDYLKVGDHVDVVP